MLKAISTDVLNLQGAKRQLQGRAKAALDFRSVAIGGIPFVAGGIATTTADGGEIPSAPGVVAR